ncbi:hypothetical protein D3C87_1577810 [compost metagenome]
MLTQDFHGDSALPGNHVLIVEGRNEVLAGLLGQLQRMGQGHRKAGPVQHCLGAATAYTQHLQLRRVGGHDDGSGDAEFPCRQRHALGMIAG